MAAIDCIAGMHSVYGIVMFNAIKADNAKYAAFAANMVAALAAEEASIGGIVRHVAANVDSNAATVRPAKKA